MTPLALRTPLTDALSALLVLGEKSGGAAPTIWSLADFHRVLRELSDDKAGEFVEHLNAALRILREDRP